MLGTVSPLLAQPQQKDNAEKVYSVRERLELQLLDFDYKGVSRTLVLEEDYVYEDFYRNHVRFIKAMVTLQDNEIDHYLHECRKFLDFLGTQKTQTYIHGLAAESLMERAVVKFFRKNYMAAVNDIRQARKHVAKQKREDLNELLYNRVEGLLKVALSVVPKKYMWAVNLLGWEKDFSTGLKQLELAGRKCKVLRGETMIILYYVDRNLTADKDLAFYRTEKMLAYNPEPIWFRYLWATAMIDRGETDKALDTLLANPEVTAGLYKSRFPFVYHLLGRAYLYQLNYNDAIREFDRFLVYSKSPLLRQDAIFKLAMAEALSDRQTSARQHLEDLLTQKASELGEDEYARRKATYFLKYGFKADELALMKARYLYDGGYYLLGQAVLDDLAQRLVHLNYDVKCELYYRYGRIFQARGKYEQAKAYYNLAIRQPSSLNKWMSAYGYYHIGHMFEQQADWHQARWHYQQALNLEDYEYQAGLEQKAKAGLERMKNKSYEMGDDQ